VKELKNLRVAIVHDWLVGGGAERVVLEMHRMFPNAPIYTSYVSKEWRQKLDGKVVTGFLQHWPFSMLRKFLPLLRIWWFTHLDFSAYDLVISSSGNGEAKGIKTGPNTTHICYCHTPTHFYWRHYNHYLKEPGFGMLDPLARLGLRILVGPLRRWDLKAAQRPDYIIANSSHIQADIKRFYGRESVVISPPIDTERFSTAQKFEKTGFVTVGRQKPYKRTDLIVQACTELNVPLTVVGKGPEHNKLLGLAGPTVKFVKDAGDKDVEKFMASAQAFLFAAHEDFGVTPVEAMAAGTPVIAYKAGGALDYVVPGKTGKFFDKQTVSSLAQAVQSFKPEKYDPKEIKAHAQQFSTDKFRQKLSQFISSVVS
jgi:glycosyltransferase involved in cell wall biosynthesis